MTFWVAGAAIVGGIGGAIINSKSADKAADKQSESAKEANNTMLTSEREARAYQEKLDARSYADSAPYRAVGVDALNKLAGSQNFTGADLASEPGYQFGLAEGNRGLTNSAAARGGLLSGAALKASTRYAQDYAGTKYNEAFSRDQTNKNRLATLAGIGQTATGQSASSGAALGSNVASGMMGTASAIGNNITGAGNARASSYLAQGNAISNGLNQGLSAWNQYNSLAAPQQRAAVYDPSAYNNTQNFQDYGWNFSP